MKSSFQWLPVWHIVREIEKEVVTEICLQFSSLFAKVLDCVEQFWVREIAIYEISIVFKVVENAMLNLHNIRRY